VAITVILAGVLFVLDLWFGIFSEETLGKVIMTLVIAGAVVGIVVAIRGELDDDRQKKDGGFYN
jgi:hypothetical protein